MCQEDLRQFSGFDLGVVGTCETGEVKCYNCVQTLFPIVEDLALTLMVSFKPTPFFLSPTLPLTIIQFMTC